MIPPRCECGHGRRTHGVMVKGPYDYCHASMCNCPKYRPKRIQRAPIARRSAAPKRTKRPRRERKTPLAKLKRQLWTAFAGYVKERDGTTCFVCGAAGLEGQNRHAGHLFNSGNNSIIRYHPQNVHVNCGRCNVWLRGNIAVYAARFLDTYGIECFRALDAKRGVAKAWTRPEIEEMLAALAKGGADYECWYFERYGR